MDQAKQFRNEGELNLTALIARLESNIINLKDQPKVTQYSSGASNWTYCLSYPLENVAVREITLRHTSAGTKGKGCTQR